MSHPRRGRVIMRWRERDSDWVVDWGPGPGRLKGPAGGLLRLIIGGSSDEDEAKFRAELDIMGFDYRTLRVVVDSKFESQP